MRANSIRPVSASAAQSRAARTAAMRPHNNRRRVSIISFTRSELRCARVSHLDIDLVAMHSNDRPTRTRLIGRSHTYSRSLRPRSHGREVPSLMQLAKMTSGGEDLLSFAKTLSARLIYPNYRDRRWRNCSTGRRSGRPSPPAGLRRRAARRARLRGVT